MAAAPAVADPAIPEVSAVPVVIAQPDPVDGRADVANKSAGSGGGPALAEPRSVGGDIASPITTNFTKFQEREVKFLGDTWLVSAGHHFDNEIQENWGNAWCYTSKVVEGVNVQVELANPETFHGDARGPIASTETLNQVGFSSSSALA